MRNKISVNAKYWKKNRLKKMNNHNLRIENVDYLLEEPIYKNVNFIYGNGKNLIDVFENSMERKRKTSRAFKTSRDNDTELIEMVVSLSEEQAKYYLDNDISLIDGYKQFMADMRQQYGFEPLSVNLHTDEGYIQKDGSTKYNIHAHCIFHNFDFEKNKTVLRTLKKQDWRDMQDLAANSFQKTGLDFQRGDAKLENSKDHLERNDFISNKQNKLLLEQEQQILKEKDKLEKLIKEQEQVAKIIRDEYLKYTQVKKNIKVQRSNFEKDSLQYKQFTKNYKEIIELDKSKRYEYKKLKESIKQHTNLKKSLEAQITSLDNNIIKKEVKIEELETISDNLKKDIEQLRISDKDFDNKVQNLAIKIREHCSNGFGIIDKDKLDKTVAAQIKKYSNIDIQLESARKDRMAANDANIEKKDIEKRYVQLLEDNEQLEDLLLKERLSHKNLKDNSIQKEIINGILEKSNMPNLEELEKIQKKKEDQERKKSNSNMRFR